MSAVKGRFKSAGRDCHSVTREKIETISDAICEWEVAYPQVEWDR